jgi:hypothetical protein
MNKIKSTQIPYQMMFVSSNSNTTAVTEFTPGFQWAQVRARTYILYKSLVRVMVFNATFNNHVFRTGGPFWLISEVIKNMAVVFIRKNCIRMGFVYFIFGVCKKNFLLCPVHPAFFIILVVAISFWWGTKKNEDKNEQFRRACGTPKQDSSAPL